MLKSKEQKENKIMHWLQTILLGLTTTGIIFCLKFLWQLNGFMEKTVITDSVQDQNIITLKNDVSIFGKETQGINNRVTYLEAILPEEKRKKPIQTR